MIGALTAVVIAAGVGSSSTFEATVAGAKCESRVALGEAQMDCVYKIGNDLQFTIAGVGMEMASISFEKSSDSGRHFAKFGMLHQCVIVSPGRANEEDILTAQLAFVSPRTGRVYRDWMECKER